MGVCRVEWGGGAVDERDGPRWHSDTFPPSEDYRGEGFFFFSEAKGGRTVNETEVKQSRRDI